MAERTAERDADLNRMVTEKRAVRIALKLFRDEYADGSDCRAELGREGQPCRLCAEHNEAWARRVAEVREAVKAAFE